MREVKTSSVVWSELVAGVQKELQLARDATGDAMHAMRDGGVECTSSPSAAYVLYDRVVDVFTQLEQLVKLSHECVRQLRNREG